MIINKKENWYEELFDVFADHGLTLTQTEIGDIMQKVHEVSEQSQGAGQVDAVVSGSLPDDEAIEDKALDYTEDEIYLSTGEGHDTCREWAFVAGAKWMRDQIGNDH